MYFNNMISDFGINPLSGGKVSVTGHMVTHEERIPSWHRPMLDRYHDGFIADILKNIRNGGVDFVFKPSQLEELKQYEPNLKFTYRDGVYSVYLSPIQIINL